ncbi:thiosulfate sulfurtransferase 16, chloroplastic-like isoform X2 [Typha latifolia]|uniref:thiosulfate sulfurtransferase 16, chloroplastic-like isoform X2 n=1 Tax=Typha latifolia TaxID=4733 RepID=UPI003C2C136C
MNTGDKPHPIEQSSPSSFLIPLMASSLSSKGVVLAVNVGAASDLIRSGHLYLDVRTVEEFNEGRLENSIHVPYLYFTSNGRDKNPLFLEQVSSVCNKDDFIVVGCRSGARSHQACVDLICAGYKNVKNMDGGIAAWIQNGFALKKPQQEQ